MASAILYPPIVDGYIPAVAGNQKIFIPFTFSKFNAAVAEALINGDTSEGLDPLTIHVTINEVVSGQSAVNTGYLYNDTDFEEGYKQSNGVYAASGIIINLKPVKVPDKEDLFQIQLPQELFANLTIGKKYKIQLRLSGKIYTGQQSGSSIAQADWLASNASYFSEWSTICILKYTSVPQLQFKNLIGDPLPAVIYNGEPYLTEISYTTENLLVYGSFINSDEEEYLTSYRIKIYSTKDSKIDELVDDSRDVEINSNAIGDSIFDYEFKSELVNQHLYYVLFSYTTNNYFSDSIILKINVILDDTTCDIKILTIDDNNAPLELSSFTSIGLEEDDARIALFFTPTTGTFSPDMEDEEYRIKRYSSKDNFSTSEVIMNFSLPESNSTGFIGPYYDTTIESGVLYKYAIQRKIDELNYSASIKTDIIVRNFDFSFLLGFNKLLKNIKQLKLAFNQEMNNFNINVNDAQMTTLGSKYPFITRNGDTRYRQFPISGLISFNMDENGLFVTEDDIYESDTIKNYYKDYKVNRGINIYNDVYYERKFRDYVLDFLYEDRAKLFKSPTEGNIIVRITNVSCSPNQSLNKMIYSFSGTGLEIAEANVDNYKKYKIINIDLGKLNTNDIHYVTT